MLTLLLFTLAAADVPMPPPPPGMVLLAQAELAPPADAGVASCPPDAPPPI